MHFIRLILITLIIFKFNYAFSLDWNDVYQTKTGQDKHKIITQLAKQGDGKAQFVLSYHYRLGEFVEMNWKLADKWLIKSANNGYAEAEYMLGSSYNSPKYNFPVNNEKAVFWLQRAAKHGHIDAQYELGEHYHVGLGINKDLILSYVWLVLASRNESFIAIRSRNMVENEMTEEQLKTAKTKVPVYLDKYVKQIKSSIPLKMLSIESY